MLRLSLPSLKGAIVAESANGFNGVSGQTALRLDDERNVDVEIYNPPVVAKIIVLYQTNG